jgi:hypothetical protein
MSWERDLFPAFDAWQARCRRPGYREPYDDLWRAACWDAEAKQLLAAGQRDAAITAWRRARDLEDAEFANEPGFGSLLDLQLYDDQGHPL